MPGIIKLIESDHREVEKLFAQFKQSPSEELALEICNELDVHATAEERVLYPVIERDVSEKLASEAEKEHTEAKQLIGRIKRTKDLDHITELMTELEAAVNHHVQEEENELLPKAKADLGEPRLTELGEEFRTAKEEQL
jgi:iron-sulfur cluster repair protein YtfE (RIC family)